MELLPLHFGYRAMDPLYVFVALGALILGALAQGFIKTQYAKWQLVKVDRGIRGADWAREMLVEGGATSVGIQQIAGELTDHYDPKSNSLNLSHEAYAETSVAALAVACHEAGHALQRAHGYVPYKLRQACVPAVNFAQSTCSLALFAGVVLNFLGLIQLALVLFGISVLFQIITLPVEIDASRRAAAFLSTRLSAFEQKGVSMVLIAAASTYVASALASIMNLLYLLGRFGSRERS